MTLQVSAQDTLDMSMPSSRFVDVKDIQFLYFLV